MACGGSSGCKVDRPKWGGSGTGQLGVCDRASLSQCDAVFSADTVTINSTGAAADTLTFAVRESNFTKLLPVGIIFDVVRATGVDLSYNNKAVGFTALLYQDVNYKLNRLPAPLSLFSPYAEHALCMAQVGMLTPGNQNVTVDLASMLPGTTDVDFIVSAHLYGWAVRGGGGAGAPNSTIG